MESFKIKLKKINNSDRWKNAIKSYVFIVGVGLLVYIVITQMANALSLYYGFVGDVDAEYETTADVMQQFYHSTQIIDLKDPAADLVDYSKKMNLLMHWQWSMFKIKVENFNAPYNPIQNCLSEKIWSKPYFLSTSKKNDCFGTLWYRNDKTEVIFVCRGTNTAFEMYKDTDTTQKKIVFPDKTSCYVHRGFLYFARVILPQINQIIEINSIKKNCKMTFVGHSLGSAVSAILALIFFRSGYNSTSVHLFACPFVGDYNFATLFQKPNDVNVEGYLYINTSDIIPKLPLPKVPQTLSATNPWSYYHPSLVNGQFLFTTNRESLALNHSKITYLNALSKIKNDTEFKQSISKLRLFDFNLKDASKIIN